MNLVRIGDIELASPICLSPMAGVSSLPFRVICRSLGATYSPTELTSARSIRYNGIEKSMQYMRIDPASEGITAIQLFGSEPEDFTCAIERILDDDRLNGVSMIDINMGCPVAKVIKTGAGSALLKDPGRASAIVKAAVAALSGAGRQIPVTVKTRIGFDRNEKGSPDFARMLADSGARMICVHGRTQADMYSGKADIGAIALMRRSVEDYDLAFFANGDISDGLSARRMLDETGADGLMVGRAATGNPWVFDKIRRELDGREAAPVTLDERKRMLIKELEGRCLYAREDIAVREMRGVMTFYIKGTPGAAQLKVALCGAVSLSQVREILFDE